MVRKTFFIDTIYETVHLVFSLNHHRQDERALLNQSDKRQVIEPIRSLDLAMGLII